MHKTTHSVACYSELANGGESRVDEGPTGSAGGNRRVRTAGCRRSGTGVGTGARALRDGAQRVRSAVRNETGDARTPEGGMGARAASCERSGTGTRQAVASRGERSDTEQVNREQPNGERGQRERQRRGRAVVSLGKRRSERRSVSLSGEREASRRARHRQERRTRGMHREAW